MPSATSLHEPETYYLTSPTPHVPNSILPVLIYRNCLPSSLTPSSVCSAIEPNSWIKGGVFKHYGAHHFHSVTHECYSVFKGGSKLLLGRGPLDEVKEDDLVVEVKEGDAIVLPAGVAHCSLESWGSMSMWGCILSPHWDNNFCKAGEEETQQKAANAKAVPIPDFDPLFGRDGPLVRIWRGAREKIGEALMVD